MPARTSPPRSAAGTRRGFLGAAGRLAAAGLLAALWAAAPVFAQSAGKAAETRYALVIGNADYRHGPLKNPVNDARAMAARLQALGFNVTLKTNATLSTMMESLRALLVEGRRNDVRLFYYAGHGVQVKGRNYLVPVDVEALNEDELVARSADLNGLIDRLSEFRKGLNLLILDACRNNPFTSMTLATADGRVLRFRGAVGSGLAVPPSAEGTLVAYATAPGAIAMDGANAANGLYTRHLLANIETPGLTVEQLFKRVRMAVATETKRMQIPWENNSMMGDFCFKTAPGGRCGGDAGLVDTTKVK